MQGSIARHHVEYRIGSRSPAAAALLPGIDRVIQHALASAIEGRLERALGDSDEVIVVREATANVTLRERDCALSTAVIDQVSASAADAVVAVVASPAGTDMLMRFASETEFVGSFIAEVLSGTARDRWFFAPLHGYMRDTAGATIAAVLADHDAVQIRRWLKDRGYELPGDAGGTSAGDAFIGEPVTTRRPVSATDVTPLRRAAWQILSVVGWNVEAVRWQHLCAGFEAGNPGTPDWRDGGSLTSWVIELIRFVTTRTSKEHGGQRIDPGAAEGLLQGKLDWLEVPAVRAALALLPGRTDDVDRPAHGTQAMPADQHSSSRVERILHLMVDQVRRGMWMPPRASAHDVARSLVASIADPQRGGAVDDVALVAGVEPLVTACFTLIADRTRGMAPPPPPRAEGRADAVAAPSSAGVKRAIATLSDAGPAAAPLLQYLVAPAVSDGAGEMTSLGGLFLLTRPVMDVKLPFLAREAGIPLASVLSIVARALFRTEPPFDGPGGFWIGSDDPGVLDCALDDDRLDLLRIALEELLFDQHLRAASLPDVAAHPRVVMLLVRAWARWLPALHGASIEFLVRNCLDRGARVRVTDAEVDVALDPAPLDVVLDMAGCFRPIDTVAWLGGRRMTFAVSKGPSHGVVR